MGKYEPLARWLREQPEYMVRVSLSDIERIVGFTLPESARKYQAFWAGSAVNPELKRVGWHAYFHLTEGAIEFRQVSSERPRSVTRAPTPQGLAPAPTAAPPDIVLLGCVKTKRPGKWPARDLYTSTLFLGRMAYAESTERPWFVLSAKYGILAPDDDIEDYDVSLIAATAAEREVWALRALAGLDEKCGSLSGKVVEIHAGQEYRVPALLKGIRERGGSVTVPLAALGIGKQFAWYARFRHAATAETPAVALGSRPSPVSAAEPVGQRAIDVPQVAGIISRDFMEGRFDLAKRANAPPPTWDSMPEFVAARRLESAGASPQRLRVFLTFMAAMDRAREADRLWLNGSLLFEETPWAFDSTQIVARSFGELGDALSRAGVSQRHGPDTAAWRTIAESLQDERSPETVRRAVFEGVGTAPELIDAVRSLDNRRTWYPFLAGPKISQMWVRMLSTPGGAVIAGLEHLEVAVDVQVRKVTEYLGVTETTGRGLDEIRGRIQRAWRDQASDVVAPGPLAHTAAGLDPGLWFMGKWGCTFCERARRKMPISDACGRCRLDEIQGGHDASSDPPEDAHAGPG